MTAMRMPDVTRRAVDAGARAVRELTPGQRWTTGLMVGLALLVLGFGLPSATRTVFPAGASETELSQAPQNETVGAVAPPALTNPIVRPLPAQPDHREQPTVEPTEPADPAPGSKPFLLLALYDPTVGSVERTDEAMARLFLAGMSAPTTLLPADATDAVCAAAAGAGLVISAGALPAAVGSCLRGAGVMSLTFDDAALPGAVELAVTARRGVVRSLFDTAALASSELKGSLGLVADERLRGVLEPQLSAARAAGLNVTTSVWLPAGEPPADAALKLAGAGLAGVLFATTTQNQSVVGSQLRTLSPSTALVVLDAADSITSGAYPPVLDGAIAVTSVQLPWHEGSAEQRSACRSTWESAQTPPTILGDAELLRALIWCQHAAMAAAVAERAPTLGLPGALLGLDVSSPITSPLGALRDGGYGPTTVTRATWGASCGCWSSTSSFERSASDDG